jgi:hypothetical protein
MDLEVESAPAAYINRAPGHTRAIWRGRLEAGSGRHTTGRAVDRMLIAFRAYEQRAQRRAAMHAWLIARHAASGSPNPRGRIATPEAAN